MSEWEAIEDLRGPRRWAVASGQAPFVTAEQKHVADYTGRVIAAALVGVLDPLIADAVAQVIAAMRDAEAAPASETPPPIA